MREVQIPQVNDVLKLAEDWHFELQAIGTNMTYYRVFYPNGYDTRAHVILAGEELIISRILVRPYRKDENGVTLKFANKRSWVFWTKLSDFNNMKVE